jgi:hypothetical protein
LGDCAEPIEKPGARDREVNALGSSGASRRRSAEGFIH